MSQLRRDTQLAREQLLQAINPSVVGSPLALIHSSLTERLERYAKSQQEQLEELKKAASEHQRDVREAVNRIEVRRTEELRSTRGGRIFEDAVLDFVQRAVGGHGYVVENTGSTVGIRPACKVGDAVIRFPPDHAFREARIVIEAKCDKSYSVPTALAELEMARANRGACSGIFVMAKSRACAGFPPFGRFGQDVLLVWDDEDPVSDPYLEAALMVALALAVRHRTVASDGDLQALQRIEQRIAKEVERPLEIRSAADKIRRQVELIDAAVDSGSSALQRLLKDAKKTLCALKVELNDDQEERTSPILLSPPANDAGSVLAGE